MKNEYDVNELSGDGMDILLRSLCKLSVLSHATSTSRLKDMQTAQNLLDEMSGVLDELYEEVGNARERLDLIHQATE